MHFNTQQLIRLFEFWNIQNWSNSEFDNEFYQSHFQNKNLTLRCDHKMKFHGWQQRALKAFRSVPPVVIRLDYLWYVSTKPKHLLLRKLVTASIHVKRMSSWLGLKAGMLHVFWDVALCQLRTVDLLQGCTVFILWVQKSKNFSNCFPLSTAWHSRRFEP